MDGSRKTVAVMQPTVFPWLGYFMMIKQVDVFVFFDDVQLVRRSWGVRNRIKTSNGELFLTIPIKKTAHRDDILYSEAIISYAEPWQQKFIRSIEINYKKGSGFQDSFCWVSDLISFKADTLAAYNANFIKGVCDKFKIKTQFVFSSQIEAKTGTKDGLIADICQALGATDYLSPPGSAEYINSEITGGEFTRRGLGLWYMAYNHPVYPQLWGDFLSHLSVIDLLLNQPLDDAIQIFDSGKKQMVHYSDS